MTKRKCAHCVSNHIKKDGHIHRKKYDYFCPNCGLLLTEDGQDWLVSDEKKEIVKNLLKEHISLAGISRACNVSESWLYDYLDEVYEEIEDDLNTIACCTDEEHDSEHLGREATCLAGGKQRSS